MNKEIAPSLSKGGERNYGIDLLKIVAMAFICILHVCNYGGVTSQALAKQYPVNHGLVLFLQAVTYCAVNIYAMVSGYLGYNKKFKLSRPFMIWLEVVFYMLCGTLLTSVFFPDQLKDGAWLHAVMPVMYREYWYVTAYIGMVVLMPLLNVMIQKASLKTLGGVLTGVLVFYSIVPTFMDVSVFGLGSGYSTLWLCVMYIAGGFFARIKKPKPLITFAVFIAVVILTWIFKMNDLFSIFKYTSWPVVAAAASLLLTFSQIKIKAKLIQKAVSYVAASTFGIYIIHVHAFFWDNYLKDCAKDFAKSSAFLLFLMIMLFAAAIFFMGLAIDSVRRGLFWLIHIKPLMQKVDRLLEKLFAGKKAPVSESEPGVEK